MALETAAAIIGVLAAAGKVADTLGPVVSAFKDVTQNIAAVLSEVNNSRIILSALHRYLDDLDRSPRIRRELIQVDQLIAALTDGVLLFSELEALVLRLVGQSNKIPSRMQWAWNDEKFASLVSRMQNFKSSITVMLNILQCESDMEAYRSRQELLLLTSNLLQSNLELATRIAHLENYLDTSNSTITRRPSILATADILIPDVLNTRLQYTNDALALLPHDASIIRQFERILLASRVYRKAKRHTSDVSFQSTIGLSHAWTALSDISLSDISKISVIALPIHWHELSNQQHYGYQLSIKGSESILELGDASTTDRSLEVDEQFRTNTAARPEPAMSPGETPLVYGPPLSNRVNSLNNKPIQLRLFIKGGREAETRDFVKQFATRATLLKKEESEPMIAYSKTYTLYGSKVDLNIRVLRNCSHEKAQSMGGNMFMLVYNVGLTSSLDRISRYYQDVLKPMEPRRPPILVVAIKTGKVYERRLLQEGMALAEMAGCGFDGPFEEGDTAAIGAAVLDLLKASLVYNGIGRSEWERRVQEEKRKEMLPRRP